ncbi:MAG: DUF192 domain-containing protein [Clostridia bacterium]|nr:DUF192 domain-containing protein [Clostridia bacterium]
MIWSQVRIASEPWSRLRGLLGRRCLSQGEGLLIKPCRQIHMFFMYIPLDAIFLDSSMKIVKIMTLMPWQISPLIKNAYTVLEVAAGDTSRFMLQPGDLLDFISTPEEAP